MLGNIQRILKNRFGSVSFGFILGEDGNDYFFHKSSLKNCTIYQLEEGDSVEFEEEFDSGKENYFTNSVRKRFSSITDASQSIVNPGINPSVHFLDKNQDELKIINSLQKVFYITNALFYISRGIQQLTKTNIDKLHSETDYRRNSANISFEEDIVLCLKGQDTPITIMFDEIEAITFDVETSGENWKSGESYLHFWDILRGFCSKYPQKLSIVIAGTNPMINELPTITSTNNRNPMCGQLSTSNQGAYLPPFDVNSTEAMVNTLGGYMGLQFSKETCGRLSSDCGGHPYLIRLFCSCINKYIKDNDISRPVIVTKAIYEKATPLFEKSGEAEAFFLMVLNILQSCYEKEYNALKILATSGDEQISQTLDNKDLQHLLGYGLIENNAGRYAIRFDTIERFLQGKYKFERQGLSISEQKEEINLRFDNAERKLRTIVRDTLRQALGTEIGKETVINAMRHNSAVTQKMIDVATTLQFKQLFDSTLNKGMFFTTLIKIIGENYSLFSNVFSANKSDVINHLNVLNQSRTLPGHSAPENVENWKTSDFEKFRTSMQWCEKIMSEFD